MYAVTVRDHVMIAHSLPRPVFGPAQGLHGATYVVEATFRRQELDDDGIVVDIGAATAALEVVLSRLRYKNLDDIADFDGLITTTEVLARWISDRLVEATVIEGLDELEVTLRESPDAWGVIHARAMRLRFVVPKRVESPTGGNVYDLAVSAAMRRAGDVVDLVRVEADGLAEALKQPWSGSTLVDGLLVSHQPEVPEATPLGVLVHMPLAWRSGMTLEQTAEAHDSEGRTLRAAVAVVATSAWTSEFLERRYHVRGVAVAAPGVDAAPMAAGSDPPKLVHVAAILPHKDQLAVVEALAQLKDLPWQASLAGSITRDPEYAVAVRNAIAAHDLTERVQILGEVDRDDAWAGADLALLPSRVESYGMVVTEALARGIPAIVSDGGPAEAVGFDPLGKRPGVVIPAGDIVALVSALARWLIDENHRAALRESALRCRELLSGWEVTGACIRDVFGARG